MSVYQSIVNSLESVITSFDQDERKNELIDTNKEILQDILEKIKETPKLAYGGKRVFIVQMLRWGSSENHSYIIGAWSKYEEAEKEAKYHMVHRGGKYDAEILEVVSDSCHLERYRYIAWGDFDITEYCDED